MIATVSAEVERVRSRHELGGTLFASTFGFPFTPVVDLHRQQHAAHQPCHETRRAPDQPDANTMAQQDRQYDDGYDDEDDDVRAIAFHSRLLPTLLHPAG
jgi:hypothetical protein